MPSIAIIHPRVLSYDDFTPDTSTTGIPGSEETLINISVELCRQGCQVDVFTQTNKETVFNGVNWVSLLRLSSELHYDALILWTDNLANIEPISNHLPKSKQRFVRLVNQGVAKNLPELLGPSGIGLTQTQWFLNHDPALSLSRLLFWPNGIIPTSFPPNHSKIPKKIFYGSDYDRGLLHILQLWPRIRHEHPDATLTVCYGWELFEKKASQLSNEQKTHLLKFQNLINQLFEQPGINHLGRISHELVNAHLLESEYWFYPCTFPENCSTLSLKAQAARCIPVIIPSGGLHETVRYGYLTKRYMWSRGYPDNDLLEESVNEWSYLALKALSAGYHNHHTIIEANYRHVMSNHSYAMICSKFIASLF